MKKKNKTSLVKMRNLPFIYITIFALIATVLVKTCSGDGFQSMFSGATTFETKYRCDFSTSGSPKSCLCKGENCYLTDNNFHFAVEKCLEEAPRNGLCANWGKNFTNYGLMPNWDTSRITNMDGKVDSEFVGFGGRSSFNGDLSNWNTAQVMTMNYMFAKAAQFNQDISKWDTSKVREMNNMFNEAVSFNQKIGRWNTSQVTNMVDMFNGALEFNQYVYTWKGLASTSLQTNMFLGAKAFKSKYSCTDPIHGPASSCTCLSNHCVTDETFYLAIESCLSEDPINGICTMYGLVTTKFLIMPC